MCWRKCAVDLYAKGNLYSGLVRSPYGVDGHDWCGGDHAEDFRGYGTGSCENTSLSKCMREQLRVAVRLWNLEFASSLRSTITYEKIYKTFLLRERYYNRAM